MFIDMRQIFGASNPRGKMTKKLMFKEQGKLLLKQKHKSNLQSTQDS